jgi:hypothetical protein
VIFRTFWTLCFIASLAAQNAPHAELARVQSVYVLPMASGYHQHLTDQLGKLGLFQIVTDPLRADSILTDRLGDAFESRLNELDTEARRRAPAPEPAAKTDGKEGGGNQQLELAARPLTSAIARGKGTIFLVDRGSRRVLWSTYRRAKSSLPDDLQRNAARIADELKKDWGGPKK